MVVAAAVVAVSCMPDRSDLLALTRGYLELPSFYADALSNGTEAQQRERMRSRFVSLFGEQRLARELSWLSQIELQSDEMSVVINKIGKVSDLATSVQFEGASLATVTVAGVAEHTYTLESNLRDVNELFEMFPISNVRVSSLTQELSREPVPESVGFLVRARHEWVFRCSARQAEWRIDDVSDRVLDARVTLVR